MIYFDVGAFFLEFAGDACDGPPCACSCHQHVHFTWWHNVSQKKSKHDILGLRLYNTVSHTITLLQDLLSRGVIVSQRVARVTVLVQNVRVWDLIFKAPSHTNVRLWWVEASTGWCAHNLSSKCSQYIHLYLQNTEETWKKSPQRKKINSNMVHLWSKTAGDNYHHHGKMISKICSLVSRRSIVFLFLPYQDS